MTATLLDWPTAPAGLKPAADEVHVWAAALDRPRTRSPNCRACLSDEERQRAERFRHAPSRDEFIVARALLAPAACANVSAWTPRQVRFSQTARGKPRLAAEPPPLCFNVSHSHGMALFALTGRCEVGVDVERVRPFSDEMGLAERFFTPREAAALRALDAAAGWRRSSACGRARRRTSRRTAWACLTVWSAWR